jgi:hypothetical protein
MQEEKQKFKPSGGCRRCNWNDRQSRPILPVLGIFGRQGYRTPAKIGPAYLGVIPNLPALSRMAKQNGLPLPAPPRFARIPAAKQRGQ